MSPAWRLSWERRARSALRALQASRACAPSPGSVRLRRQRLLLALCLGLAALLAGAGPARAHTQARSTCHVRTVTAGLEVSVLTAGHLLAQPLGLGVDRPGAGDLEAVRTRYQARLGEALRATTPAGACEARDLGARVTTTEDEPALEGRWAFSCPPGPVTLVNAWRLDVDPASECVCAIDGSAWVFRIGMTEKAVGTPPTRTDVFGRFAGSGLEHVLGGADHLLFVLLLLLGAVGAGAALGPTLRRVAAVVTGFTVGHSVTLTIATLGWVTLPARPVEAVIAASIAVVGAENVLRREVRLRGVTAAVFGLVHGFGFARVLAEQELAPGATGLALLGFNVGIELGQLGLGLVVVPLLHTLAGRAWYRRAVMVPLSLVGSAVALAWLGERWLGVEWLPG